MGLILAGHALLLLAYALDFHLDVRERDVFSWMDPYQYFDFARGVLEGREHAFDFEVPSIFPFFLMPALAVAPSVPAALWTNFAFALLLAGCVHGLCRALTLQTPSPIVAAMVLSSPLLIGLSRTLYVEYALSAVVGLAFLLWLRVLRTPTLEARAAFALVLGLGFMLKMTFPLFFALPIAAALTGRLLARRRREAVGLLATALVPVVLALIVQAAFFPRSFGYYLSLGNTTLPIMNLLGPPEVVSLRSATYYLGEVGRTVAFLLTPFLVLGLVLGAGRALRRPGALHTRSLAGREATLWLWLLGPLVLLVLQPVKEPRHVAPCALPAVLLVVLAIEQLSRKPVRRALLASALALSVVQYVAVTQHLFETPYFMDRALRWQAIRDAMLRSEDVGRYAATPEALRLLHWQYDQNVLSVGFPANEALALAWQLFPAVVLDRETLDPPEARREPLPGAQFEDPYILAAFNSYNRRCGWPHYYPTLPREIAERDAEFVLVATPDAGAALRRFPDHALLESIAREGGFVHVLRSRRAGATPYRASFANAYLLANPDLPEEERAVVANELLSTAVLGGYESRARAVLERNPALRARDPALRNIYWIGGYESITALVRQRMPRGPL